MRFLKKRLFSSQVFDRTLKHAQKNRSVLLHNENGAYYDYLRDTVALRLVDRMRDMKKSFPVVLDLGCNAGNIRHVLHANPNIAQEKGIKTLHHCDIAEALMNRDVSNNPEYHKESNITSHYKCGDELNLPFPDNSMDLVVSCLSGHWINDVAGSLKEVRRVLKPDGAFLSAIFGGNTLQELRSAFAIADIERLGGVSPHVSPFAYLQDVGDLLNKSGLALTTVDSENLSVNYPDLFTLMEHLRGMGETNAVKNRVPYVSKDIFLAAAAAFKELYNPNDDSPNGIAVTFEIIYMLGWEPDSSQQKPLKRGSATHSLKELGD